MTDEKKPAQLTKLKTVILVSIVFLIIVIIIAVVTMFQRSRKAESLLTANLGTPDEYTSIAGQLLAGLTASQINASLQSKLSYIWAQDAYYQVTGNPTSLSEITTYLGSAVKDVRTKQDRATIACLFMKEVADDPLLSSDLQSKARKICHDINYDYYVDPELQKLRDMITTGQQDTSGANSVFFYPANIIDQQTELLAEKIETYRSTGEFTWQESDQVTSKIIADNIVNQLYALFDRYYFAEMYSNSSYEADAHTAELAKLDYIYLTGEVLDWYTNIYEYEQRSLVEEPVDTRVVYDPETICLISEAISLFAESSGHFEAASQEEIADMMQIHGPAICDVLKYTRGDQVNNTVDKQFILDKFNHTDEFLSVDDYDQILTAGLLARQSITSEYEGSAKNGSLADLIELLGLESTTEALPVPDTSDLTTEEYDYYLNLVYTPEEIEGSVVQRDSTLPDDDYELIQTPADDQ